MLRSQELSIVTLKKPIHSPPSPFKNKREKEKQNKAKKFAGPQASTVLDVRIGQNSRHLSLYSFVEPASFQIRDRIHYH